MNSYFKAIKKSQLRGNSDLWRYCHESKIASDENDYIVILSLAKITDPKMKNNFILLMTMDKTYVDECVALAQEIINEIIEEEKAAKKA